MKSQTFINKTFFRFLISYFTIFMIPILILVSITYGYFIRTYRNDLTSSRLELLDNLKNTVDMQMDQLYKIVLMMGKDQEFSYDYLSNNELGFLHIPRKLMSYKAPNNFIDQLYYYKRGDDKLYLSNGVYRFSEFWDFGCKYIQWDFEDFKSKINQISRVAIRRIEDVAVNGNIHARYMTVMYPIPYDSLNYTGTVIFQIREETMDDYLKNPGRLGGMTLIINKSGEVLYSNQMQVQFSINDFKEVFDTHETSGIQTVNINSKEYLVIFSRSSYNNWIYVNIFPVKAALFKLERATVILSAGLMIIFFLGGLGILYFMRMNYNPLKAIIKLATTTFTEGTSAKSEIELTRLAFESLARNNERLNEKLSSASFSIQQYLLIQLLKGHFSSIEQFNNAAQEFGIFYTFNTYRVLVITTKIQDVSSNQEEAMITWIEELMLPDIEAHGIKSLEDGQLIFIIASNLDQIALTQRLTSLNQAISIKLNISIRIFASEACEAVSTLYSMYMQAVSCIQYNLSDNDQVIFTNDILSIKMDYHYPKEELQILRQAVESNNVRKTEEILSYFSQLVVSGKTSLFLAICLCYDIINALSQVIPDDSAEVLRFKNDCKGFLAINNFKSTQELSSIILKISNGLCSYMKDESASVSTTFSQEVREFIEKSYSGTDFSVSLIANHFKTSLPNLSRLFKKQTGINISDYLLQYRLDKAKQLLSSTRKPVGEIAGMVGFTNATSFIKWFKQEAGSTPGEFRKVYMFE